MHPSEEKFVDDSGQYRFDWRAHNNRGHPILFLPDSPYRDHPDFLIVDGLKYGGPIRRNRDAGWLYTADAPGPIIPGQPYNLQPPFRHEEMREPSDKLNWG